MLLALHLTQNDSGLDLSAMFDDSSEISCVRPNVSVIVTYLTGSSFLILCLHECLVKASAAWACRRESHLDNGVPVMDTYRAFERNIHNQ